AVVCYRNKEACRNTVHHAHLTAKECCFTTKAHCSNSKLIGILHHVFFQFAKVFVWILIINRTEKLFFCKFITRSTVPADTNSYETCTTALALCLVDRMHNTLTNSI